MNECHYIGRLVKDPEVRYTGGEQSKAIARYTIAVPRGEEADFIQIEAWEQRATFAEKYLKKGTKVVVSGSTRTGSYTDKDGKKVYTNICVARNQEFAEKKEERESDIEDMPFR